MRMLWAGHFIENNTGKANGWRVNAGAVPYMGTLDSCKAWIRRRGWLWVSKEMPPSYTVTEDIHGHSLQWVVRFRRKKVAAFLDEEDAIAWVIGKEQGRIYGDHS